MWYVIQVAGGREEAACRLIERHAEPGSCDEVFVPRYRAVRQSARGPVEERPVLTPGYVIADARDPEALEAQLRKVPAFTRLLGGESGFRPLDREEAAWLAQWTRRGERVVQGSVGRIERGRLKVLSGPLAGREADVVRVNRRKRRAVVRMEFMGRVKEVALELELLGRE